MEQQTSDGTIICEELRFNKKQGYSNSLEKTPMLERLRVEEEGDDRRWDGWMASLTQWTWVWANSRR